MHNQVGPANSCGCPRHQVLDPCPFCMNTASAHDLCLTPGRHARWLSRMPSTPMRP